MKTIITYLFALGIIFSVNGQDEPSPILFIYDASGSMWGKMDGQTKKEIASKVLSSTVSALAENQNVGLIVYGHRAKGDCNDIEYVVDISNSSKESVTSSVSNLNPTGKTPLARSAEMAINSLKSRNTKATIILITDGIESCDGDICEVVSESKATGIDFKLHIVGFGLKKGEKEQLICAAKAGDGNYYDANDSEGLASVLTEATSETVDDPAGNFSIYAIKNGQPVDAWVKAVSVKTKKEVDAARSYQDTAFVSLSPGTYNIVIQPLENTDLAATSITIDIKEGEIQHRDISFDSGKLSISTTNNGKGWDASVRILPPGGSKAVAAGRTYGRPKELEVNPGVYDIHIKVLKIKGISVEHTLKNISVKPNETIPLSHDFKSGIAMIGVQTTDGELIDATVNFTESSSGKYVDGGRTYTRESSNPRTFTLNPGNYIVKIVTLGAHKGNDKTINLTVKKGETVEKVLKF